MMFGFRDEFTYFECTNCGCVQIQEVPENLGKYYPDDYYSFHVQGSLLWRWLDRRRSRYSYDGTGLVGWMMAGLTGKNEAVESVARARIPLDAAILDVGSGNGTLLRILHRLGFTNLAGADPFLPADTTMPEGIPLAKKDLSQMHGTFDVLMLHHSFEHMTEPAATLVQAARLLRPGGTLIIRTPIAGSYAWKHYGVNWVQLDPPRHIFLPTERGMRFLAERAGLRVTEVVHESSEFQFRASEQYLRDIPLTDPRSYLRNAFKSHFPSRELRAYRARARQLNRRGEGDSACFYLQADSSMKPGA